MIPPEILTILHRMERGDTTIADANTVRAYLLAQEAEILRLKAAVDDDAVVDRVSVPSAWIDDGKELPGYTTTTNAEDGKYIFYRDNSTTGGDALLEDGFGNAWSSTCPECGGRMEIVRPGKVQCENEDLHGGR